MLEEYKHSFISGFGLNYHIRSLVVSKQAEKESMTVRLKLGGDE